MLQIVDVGEKRLTFYLPNKKIRIPEYGKWLLMESGIRKIWFVESGILGFGIRKTA